MESENSNNITLEDMILIRRALDSYLKSLRDGKEFLGKKKEIDRVRILFNRIGELTIL